MYREYAKYSRFEGFDDSRSYCLVLAPSQGEPEQHCSRRIAVEAQGVTLQHRVFVFVGDAETISGPGSRKELEVIEFVSCNSEEEAGGSE